MIYILEEINSLNSILKFLGSILNIIHITVPIILIVVLSIDIAKAVLSQDDEKVSKVVNSAKNRIIACVLIFLLPSIVEVIFNSVSISVSLSNEEYNKILSSYKTVINYEGINATDSTKTNDIINSLSYNIISKTSEELNIKENIESNYMEISKNITSNIFKQSSDDYGDKYKILYETKEYTNKDKFNINFDKYTVNNAINNGEYIISNVSIQNASINNEKEKYNLSVEYYFKKNGNKYDLELIKIEKEENLKEYLKNIEKSENDKVITSINKYSNFKSNYYDYTKLNNLSNSTIETVYSNNSNNIVMLNTYYTSAVVNKATGFFLSNGVIVTSWSYVQDSLMNGQTIIVHDKSGNTYKLSGIVSIDIDLDIVIVKLNKEVSRSINIGDSTLLKKNDPVISVISKTGYGLTAISGIVSSSADNIVSVIPLSKNDWGSPLFNSNGQLVGMNTSKIIESDLSVSSPLIHLKDLQTSLRKTKFKDIKVQSMNDIRKKYFYTEKNKEKVIQSIDAKIWDKYKKIGNIEDNIVLDLVKSSYYENIISLRYENKTSNYISTISYSNDFIVELEKSGYKNILDTNKKKMYKKGKDTVIIMEEFDYLIIVLAKESII